MNVRSVEKHDNSTATLVLEVERAQFQAALDKAYRQVKNDIYIPGFRKGKAPRKIVEGMYGANVFYEDAINLLFPDVWAQAAKASELELVGTPSIADLNVEDTGNLILTVETGVYPEVTLGQYKGIEAEKAASEVSEEEIDAEIKKLADRNSTVETVERPAAEGDTAVIDFEGFLNGVPFEGGQGEDYNLKIGSGTFIPGFEEQLIGMSAGDERDLDVTFPEDYGAEDLAGKAVVFKVKVHEIKATNTPELDDEFAKDVSEFDTLEELRADIKANLLKEKQEGIDRAFENAVLEKAAEGMTADIPASMIDEQVEQEMERFDYQLRSQGASLEQYAKMLGGDLSGFKASIRPSAESQLRTRIMLNAVADAEKLEATDEELEEEYGKLAEAYGMDLEKVKQAVSAEDLKGDIAVRKAGKFLVDNAVATAPVEEPAAEE